MDDEESAFKAGIIHITLSLVIIYLVSFLYAVLLESLEFAGIAGLYFKDMWTAGNPMYNAVTMAGEPATMIREGILLACDLVSGEPKVANDL